MADTKDEKHIALDCIKSAQSWIEEKKEEFIDMMKSNLGKAISDYVKEQKLSKIDTILVASISLATEESVESVVKKLNEVNKKLSAQNIDNIVLAATFYNLDIKYLFGGNSDVNDKKFPRRLDKVTKLVESDGGESGSTETEVGFGLSWDNVNSWDWINYIEPLNINFTGNQKIKDLKSELTVFAKICYAYEAIRSAAGSSSFDSLNSDLAFPFFEDELSQVYFTSPFGPRNLEGSGGYHYGVDLGAPEGLDIHAAADGTVTAVLPPEQSNGGGNYVAIQHADNVYTLYMHMCDLIVANGQSISKGDIIGHVGNTGHSTGSHLHFQVNVGGLGKECAENPAKYFARLSSCPEGACLGTLKD